MDQLRTLLMPGRATLIPGAPNALTARIAQTVGFEAVMLTGAGFANTYLGAPDVGLTTLTEVADQLARMRDVVDIPIIVDADTGFGNSLNVVRTVKIFERSGANAIQLEDQTFPKRCGHFDGKSVIPVAEMLGKIKAAVDSRSQDTLILARTDAYAVEGLSSALDRAQQYAEAGADLLFIEAPELKSDLARIPQEVPFPHICNVVFGGKTPALTRQELAELGFAGVIYANAALQASILSMESVLTHLKEFGHLGGCEDQLISFAKRQQYVDHDVWADYAKKYAT